MRVPAWLGSGESTIPSLHLQISAFEREREREGAHASSSSLVSPKGPNPVMRAHSQDLI